MLLSFKTSVKKFLTSRRKTVFVVKQLLLDITIFFTEHFPMFGANIEAKLAADE